MPTTLARRPRLCPAAFLLLLGACSVVPQTVLPPTREGRVEVIYEFGTAPPVPVAVPASNRQLTVLELVTDPATAEERYFDGRRYLVVPPGTRELRIECRYLIYGQPDAEDPFATAPRILDAFPGARLIDDATQD